MVFDRIQCSKADSKVSEEMNNYSEKKLRPKFKTKSNLDNYDQGTRKQQNYEHIQRYDQ